jgi:hypothetical protein
VSRYSVKYVADFDGFSPYRSGVLRVFHVRAPNEVEAANKACKELESWQGIVNLEITGVVSGEIWG